MRKLIASIAVVLGASLAFTAVPASAAIVDGATPLRVKIAPFSGKKVKVAKKLKVLVSCTKQCRIKTKFTLVTPALKDSVTGGTTLEANSAFVTGMILNSFGKNLLKKNYKRSRFKVKVSALDIETGKRIKKTKTFKFSK
ncbi:MAG: hypothetical protein WBP55_00395 [Solirubrobacterales bacterium]